MLRVVIFIVLFFVSVLVYFHIYAQISTCSDLHVYNTAFKSAEHLYSVCAMKQPVIVHLPDDVATESIRPPCFPPVHFLSVRKLADAASGALPLRLTSEALGRLFLTETSNNDYYSDTTLTKGELHNGVRVLVKIMAPALCSRQTCRLLCGPVGGKTIPVQEIHDRAFLIPSGKATVRLVPPNCSEWLSPINDHVLFETRTEIDLFSPPVQKPAWQWRDVVVQPGTALFIPNHWWVSVRFDAPDSFMYKLSFHTYASELVLLPRYVISFLQQLTTRYKVASLKHDTEETEPCTEETETVKKDANI
jgi:hypothetical protein